jgi:hypothetical protein
MIKSFIDLVNESNEPMPKPNDKMVDEMGIKAPERLSGSSMGRIRQQTITHNAQRSAAPPARDFMEIAVELKRALKTISRMDITMETPPGTRDYYPKFPDQIVALMRELSAIDRSRFQNEFGKWRDLNPTDTDAIKMRTDSPSDSQRSHFPNSGIPSGLRGIGLGYKLYRTLLKHAGYISSNTSGTSEKDKAWGSLLAYKSKPDGTPSADDAHAIIGPSNWMALDKGLDQNTKLQAAEKFIKDTIGVGNTEPEKFDMDDELFAIMPQDFLSSFNIQYLVSLVDDHRITPEKAQAIQDSRGEAQRREQERVAREAQERRERQAREERATRKRLIVRIAKFGADPDAEWNLGDFVVVKQYLYDASYNSLPIRRAETFTNGTYTAVSIKDAMRIDSGQLQPNEATDTRTTSDKSTWVKVNINEIPDLDQVNLTNPEKAWIENLLHPEVATRVQATRQAAVDTELAAQRTENQDRAANMSTYGWVPASGGGIKQALADRPGLPDYNRLLKAFKESRFTAGLQFIVLGPPQRSAMRNEWGIPVFIPWKGNDRHPLPVQSIEELLHNNNCHLTNAVTAMELVGPFTGLNLVSYPLEEVTLADKLRARAGEHYYVAGHQNTYGVLAKSDYGTINTTQQRFIYLKVFGYDGRSVSVRLDLLRKLGAPAAI